MSGKQARVEVEICGGRFTIRGDESPEYIEMVAKYVDRKVKQLVSTNPKLSTTNAAILAAINIADELSKLQADYNNLLEMMDTLDTETEKK